MKPEDFRQAINSFEGVFNKYKDIADITKKATNCLNYTVKIIICIGLLKNGDDNDWEKIAIDSLTLIEVNNVIYFCNKENIIIKISFFIRILFSMEMEVYKLLICSSLNKLMTTYILQKDREILGKLCLKPLIETLTNSLLPIDLRKTVRKFDLINR